MAIISQAERYEGPARIGRINRAINLSIRPKLQDAWASPLATLALGEGDCKQIAVLKYTAMSDTGIAPDDLRLVVGISKSRRMLVDSVDFPGFLPQYVFDHRGVGRFLPPSAAKIASSVCHGVVG